MERGFEAGVMTSMLDTAVWKEIQCDEVGSECPKEEQGVRTKIERKQEMWE